MCGITGGIGPSAPQQLLLDAQLKSIEHRGPDDSGTYLNNGVGLGTVSYTHLTLPTIYSV